MAGVTVYKPISHEDLERLQLRAATACRSDWHKGVFCTENVTTDRNVADAESLEDMSDDGGSVIKRSRPLRVTLTFSAPVVSSAITG